eukprot:scaffold60586_cov61-Phaeocystis_antarctica.AAC.1
MAPRISRTYSVKMACLIRVRVRVGVGREDDVPSARARIHTHLGDDAPRVAPRQQVHHLVRARHHLRAQPVDRYTLGAALPHQQASLAREQVVELVIVHLEVARLDEHAALRRGERAEEQRARPRHDPVLLHVGRLEVGDNVIRAEHSVRLAGAGLAVGEDGRVVALEHARHAVLARLVEDVLLRGTRVEAPVERELE